MAAVVGIRGFREALQVRGYGGVGGGGGDSRMEGQLGILVRGRTELALFTAINSLPLTAYRFLLPPRPTSPARSRPSLRHPASLSSATLASKQFCCFFLRSFAPFQDDVDDRNRVSRKCQRSMRSIMCPPFTVFVSYERVYLRRI